MMGTWFYAATFLGFMLLAARSDAMDLRISNQLTLTMAAGGLLAVGLLDANGATLFAAVLTGAATLAIGWIMFELGWLGGGDAKLAGAAAIWLGPQFTPVFLLATTIFGALLAIVLIVVSRWDRMPDLVGGPWRTRLAADAICVPYAVAMAPAGALAIFAHLSTH